MTGRMSHLWARCLGGLRAMGRLLGIAVVGALAVTAAAVSANPEPLVASAQHQTQFLPVTYAAPMHTAVVDPFRPPAHIGAEGNRGLEYGDSEDQVVSAAAEGLVWFAGSVAGTNAITLVHADGVLTTYTNLKEVWVTEDVLVSQHAGIGVAQAGFHFGARRAEHYLDPQILLDTSGVHYTPRLVPLDAD